MPETRAQIGHAAQQSSGIKHDLLVALQHRLKRLPHASEVLRPAAHITVKAFEVIVAIFFVFASAAYWIFERDKLIDYVVALIPHRHRKTVRDTWHLIDLKLGSYVRGQGLLILIVAVILSAAFWAIHEPYWLLLGSFAGIVEVVPVIGPISAGILAIGVGLTKSWGVALAAGIVVLVQRQLEDYLIAPRVICGAVGLSPLLVMIAVISSGILLGPLAVVLAIPAVAVLSTLVNVIVRRPGSCPGRRPDGALPREGGRALVEDLEAGRLKLAHEPAARDQLAAFFGDGGGAQRPRDALERRGARLRRELACRGKQRMQRRAFLLDRGVELCALAGDDLPLCLAGAMARVEQEIDIAPVLPRELVDDPRGDGRLSLLLHQRCGLCARRRAQSLRERIAARDERAELDSVQLVERFF